MLLSTLCKLDPREKRGKRNRAGRVQNRLAGIEGLENRVVLTALGYVAANEPAEVSTVASEPVARIVNGTPTSGWDSVGLVGDSSGDFCSGTLITSNHVLTAAHCAVGVGNSAGRFTVEGRSYGTSQVFVHPQYNDRTLDNDIAIFQLSSSVNNVTPTAIHRDTPFVGQILTLVGYGAGGTGNGGHNGDFGNKRVGTTPIDQVTNTLIIWNFDNNSESNTAPGDSGGPAFVEVGGQFYVAGVTSGGDSPNAGIGDTSFDTRVDAFASWIDSITGDTGGGGPGGGGPDDPGGGGPDDPGGGGPDDPGDDHVDSPGAGATRIGLGSNGSGGGDGSLEVVGDRDVFQVDVAQSGRATIAATGITNLDTYLRVYSADGGLVARNDDFGGTLNSQVELQVTAGTYYISVGSYADSQAGDYDINVQVVADVDDGPFDNVTGIQLDSNGRGNTRGEIARGSESDMFSVAASVTGRMTIRTRNTTGDLDTMLTIYDSRGNEVAFNDDHRGFDSRVRLDVVAGETYFVEVSSYGNSTGDYGLHIRTRAASYASFAAAADSVFSQRDEWLSQRYGGWSF